MQTDCWHGHIKFVDGSHTLQCIDCDQKWNAVDAAGMPDYALKGKFILPPYHTRHDRWVIPRTEKEPVIKATILKKQ